MGETIHLNDFMRQYEALLDDPVLKERLKAFAESMSNGLDDLISDLMNELRAVTRSDAASIYVVDGNVLRFIYVQSETLEREGNLTDGSGENRYLGRTVRINENSMCGYVAKTKRPLSIGDVRHVPPDMPFGFNDEYDKSTGYRTVSALTTPIFDDAGEVAGILQLINHTDENGEIAPYEDWMLGYVMLLTEHFLPMIAKSFDRYREGTMDREAGEQATSSVSTQIREVYDGLREGLATPASHKNLPWLKGSGVSWGKRGLHKESNVSKRLLAYSHYVNQFEDVGTVIEMMLTEARDATRADGGTFYLVTGDRLRFAYFQNDTLSSDNSRNHYMNVEIPISRTSISGYVALEKKILNIPDIAYLPEGAPYSFNRSFDESSGYRTVSMLTVPVLSAGGTVLAVLQLINSMDPQGNVKAFDEADMRYADLLAGQTMPYLTKSIMARRLIDTMLRMSEMRDPLETGAHVQRVGAFAAEIYQRWAENRGTDIEEIRRQKDTLRLAAMLHDIGKVAVPDAILKKPGKLTEEEFAVIKTHCAKGSEIYAEADSKLERLAYEITLHHHQRWDGRGYTGNPDIPILAGEDIPLFARATSVADVLDALAFPRVYKPAWGFDKALEELQKNAGTQFDPEMVTAADQIADTLRAIIARYQ